MTCKICKEKLKPNNKKDLCNDCQKLMQSIHNNQKYKKEQKQ